MKKSFASHVSDPKTFLIVGHRGAPRRAPENTLLSFRYAVHDGADMIEFDVRLTRDGVPIISHDAEMHSPGKPSVRIDSLTHRELILLEKKRRRRRPGRSPRFPTLRETLRRFLGRIPLNIELKTGPGNAARLVRAVLGYVPKGREASVIFSSFSPNALKEIRRRRPKAQIGVLFAEKPEVHLRMAKRLRAFSVHPKDALCTRVFIQKAHAAGFRVMPWTVNSRPRVKTLIRWGADGVFTDVPHRMKPLVKHIGH